MWFAVIYVQFFVYPVKIKIIRKVEDSTCRDLFRITVKEFQVPHSNRPFPSYFSWWARKVTKEPSPAMRPCPSGFHGVGKNSLDAEVRMGALF
jgi:hypothetical protein